MNILVKLASFLSLPSLRVEHPRTVQAETGHLGHPSTRGRDFPIQPWNTGRSSLPLEGSEWRFRLVSHWVRLEGGSRRMFWTLTA